MIIRVSFNYFRYKYINDFINDKVTQIDSLTY